MPARSRKFAASSTPTNSRPPWSGLGAVTLPGPYRIRQRQAVRFDHPDRGRLAIKKAGGPNLDKRTVELPKAHIKATGTYQIGVKLHPGVTAAVSLNVTAE